MMNPLQTTSHVAASVVTETAPLKRRKEIEDKKVLQTLSSAQVLRIREDLPANFSSWFVSRNPVLVFTLFIIKHSKNLTSGFCVERNRFINV